MLPFVADGHDHDDAVEVDVVGVDLAVMQQFVADAFDHGQLALCEMLPMLTITTTLLTTLLKLKEIIFYFF